MTVFLCRPKPLNRKKDTKLSTLSIWYRTPHIYFFLCKQSYEENTQTVIVFNAIHFFSHTQSSRSYRFGMEHPVYFSLFKQNYEKNTQTVIVFKAIHFFSDFTKFLSYKHESAKRIRLRW